MKKELFFLGILFCVFGVNAQTGFQFLNEKYNYETIKFRLISNLIVIPVEINGKPLTFILDSGANNTLLFNTSNTDSLQLNNTKKIPIRGLGTPRIVEAIDSNKNIIKIGKIIDSNKSVKLILDDKLDFSKRLGIPIHGIIGTDLLTNFITEINYSNKKIRFYKPEKYNYNRVRSHNELDLLKYKNRFFINSAVNLNNSKILVKMLLDTGSSDTVWLFEDEKKSINIPRKNFKDFMGIGISGDVYGKRSRLERVYLKDYTLENTNVSFPDSTYVKLIKGEIGRNGSIGANLIKRFNVTIDTKNSKLYLKKNRFFKKPFNYNMSGLEIEHIGVKKVSFWDFNIYAFKKSKTFYGADFLKIKLIPIFNVAHVREGSPAYESGVRVGDILISIDKKSLEGKRIDEIRDLLSSRDGKRIRITVNREEKIETFNFKLKKIL